MKQENPFTLSFGKKPLEYISQGMQVSKITETFDMETPTNHVYILTGVRGSGKTVALTEVCKYYEQRKDWIVIQLSSDSDLMHDSVSELSRKSILKRLDIEVSASLGAGISIKKGSSDLDDNALLRNALERLTGKKRVLFVIDEIANNEYVRQFVSFFQIYLRQDYPVYLLMAGLYDNVSNLQNQKTLTFLYRAPKIIMEPLGLSGMTQSYASVFGISTEDALAMARITKGYPYAFQILGYLRWESDREVSELLPDLDDMLASYVYEKVWSELSGTDRRVVHTIAQGVERTSDLKEALGMSPQLLNVYRKRLIDRGIVSNTMRGVLSLTLPRFDVYVNTYCEV